MKNSIFGLAILSIIVFCLMLGIWWHGMHSYRALISTVSSLKQDMAKMKAHVQETERVLAAVKALELQVQAARSKTDAEIEQSKLYYGSDRLDRLERLLEADLANRCNTAPAGVDGKLPASSGKRAGSKTVKGKQD